MEFTKGIKAMLPITTGVIPFGLVMGTVAFNAGLDLTQTLGMNLFVFAGASQLAAVDLMTQNTASVVVIATGLIINLRFMLYSASLSTVLQNSNLLVKSLVSYSITDQTYAVLIANQSRLNSTRKTLEFYFGASVCMIAAWQAAVLLGFIFGNFAPASLALEYAVPLSFVALVLPSLKDRNYYYVAITAATLSILLKDLALNAGLLVSGLSAIALGAFLTRRGTDAN